MEQKPHRAHVNERNQNKNKTKSCHIQIWPRILLFDLAHK